MYFAKKPEQDLITQPEFNYYYQDRSVDIQQPVYLNQANIDPRLKNTTFIWNGIRINGKCLLSTTHFCFVPKEIG